MFLADKCECECVFQPLWFLLILFLSAGQMRSKRGGRLEVDWDKLCPDDHRKKLSSLAVQRSSSFLTALYATETSTSLFAQKRRDKRAVVEKKTAGRLSEADFDCPICLQPLCQPATTRCGHTFCFYCVFPHCTSCPLCRAALSFGHFSHSKDLVVALDGPDPNSGMDARDVPLSICDSDFVIDTYKTQQLRIHLHPAVLKQREAETLATHGMCASAPEEQVRLAIQRSESMSHSEVVASFHNSATARCAIPLQQQLKFCGGYMRRRAPSLVVASSTSNVQIVELDDESENGSRRRQRTSFSPRNVAVALPGLPLHNRAAAYETSTTRGARGGVALPRIGASTSLAQQYDPLECDEALSIDEERMAIKLYSNAQVRRHNAHAKQ